MTVQIAEVPLAKSGVEYVASCLGTGRAVSHAALQHLDLAMGVTTTFVPDNVPADELDDYSTGGKIERAKTPAAQQSEPPTAAMPQFDDNK